MRSAWKMMMMIRVMKMMRKTAEWIRTMMRVMRWIEMMMKVMRKIMKWIKVIRTAVRAELMSIKTLKIDKKDSITADNESDS